MRSRLLAAVMTIDRGEVMDLLLIIVGIILALLAVYLILIAPGNSRGVKDYKGIKFAHRGLHDETRAENSMSAFSAAVEAGFGIELDVRLSKDGELVVFHDDTLDRVCGIEGRVDSFAAAELSKMSLSGTKDGIPRFSKVLELVDGKVPLLVEIKEDMGNSKVSEKCAEMLHRYKGDFIVESFNPLSLRNSKKILKNTPHGILSHKYYAYSRYRKPLYFLLQVLVTNFLCRPSFVAYDHKHFKCVSLRILRKIFGVTTFAWTIRSADEEIMAYRHGFDGVIFEGYVPEDK